jgi:hypothetical protein
MILSSCGSRETCIFYGAAVLMPIPRCICQKFVRLAHIHSFPLKDCGQSEISELVEAEIRNTCRGDGDFETFGAPS